ncbi:hypothetical protein [Cyanobium sp. PCC 7001]|uniref:hypothetical protein n=1 Tax=Cyanobium sp. PCC 7001 TaxID=180281 RepID=UPI0012E9CEB5|nr:hypothetical protein [Cyanobium sp. PCC 7001]
MALVVLLVGLAIVVGLITLLERPSGTPSRTPSRFPAAQGEDRQGPLRGLEQRLERQEAALAALVMRFERLELKLDELTAGGSGPARSSAMASAAAEPTEPTAYLPELPPPAQQDVRPVEPAPPPPPPPPRRSEPAGTPAPRRAAMAPPPPDRPRAPRTPPPRWRARWRRLERQLIANWTGLLGVVVVVVGVTFGAINVALQFNAWQRFVATLLIAAALALPSLLTRPGSRWHRLSSWMRSGGGGLLLFACTAAGGLPQLGMQWIEDPAQSLALLCLAMAVNLLLATTTAQQTVAGLHVVVCLLPLTLVPQNGLILAVASLVAVVGVVLPLGRPWYGHRLLVALAYGTFHGSWVVRALPQLTEDASLRNQAALAAALVFAGGTVLLQRPQRLRQHGLGLPLAVQLVNSGGLGLALLFEPAQIGGRGLGLAMAAGLMALLSRRARSTELPWLRRCNALVAQVFVLAALLSLGPWVANATLLAAVVLLECLAVLLLSHGDPDGVIRQLGWWLSLVAGAALALVALGDHLVLLASGVPSRDPGTVLVLRLQNCGVLLGCGGLALAMQRRLRTEPLPVAPALGWIAATLLWLGAGVIAPSAWQPPLSVAVLAGALLLGRHWQLAGVVPGLAAAITVLHLQSWLRLLSQLPWPPGSLAALTLPPLLLALLLLWDRQRGGCRALAWVLLTLSGGVWILQTLVVLGPGPAPQELVGHAVLLLAGGTALLGVQLAIQKAGLEVPGPQLMGWLAPALLLVGSLGCLPQPWPEIGATALLQLTLLLGRWRRPAGLLAGAMAATAVLVLGTWLWMLPPDVWPWRTLLPHLLPLVLVIQGLFLRHSPGPRRCAWTLLQLTALALLFSAGLAWLEGPEVVQSRAATLVVGGQLLALLAWRLQAAAIPQPLPQAFAWQAAALTTVGVGVALPAPWRGVGGLVAFGSLLGQAGRWRPAGLPAASASGVALLHGLLWLWLLRFQPWPPAAVLRIQAPLAALALLLWLVDRRRAVADGTPPHPLAVDLLGIGAGLASWLLLAPVSNLIPPVAWLLLAPLALELAARLPVAQARHALLCGVGYLLAFAIGYVLLISQSPALVQFGALSLPGRLGIELLALAVLLYGWFIPAGSGLARLRLWQRLRPLLLEALLLTLVVTVLSELAVLWRPAAWAALALLLITRPVRRLFAVRLQIYAVLLYWLSLGTLLAVLSTLQSPAMAWYLQPGQIALVTMALQVGFILTTHGQLDPAELAACEAWGPLRWIGERVSHRPHRWLYLPLFAVVAYYLWLRYDRALLTLLWTAEAFVIYGLSAVLRDGKFRLLALIALGACLLRLVAIDMAQANLGIRAVVFIGVGLLMLGMNALYNRFRSRFESGGPEPEP